MRKKLNLFEEDIESYNLYELSDWIRRCQNKVQLTDPYTFPDEVKKFCSDWSNHRQKHEKFYDGELYKQAIIGSACKNPDVLIRHKNKKFNITDSVFNDVMSFLNGIPTKNAEEFKEILDRQQIITVDNYLKAIDDIFYHKDEYKKYISIALKEFCKMNYINFNLKKLPSHIKTSAITKEELLRELRKSPKTDDEEIHQSAYPDIKEYSFVRMFKEYEISKTTYFDWQDKGKEQRAFDKKFFINLGFMLNLPIDHFETLLNYNGFTVEKSLRELDIIVCEARKCGYSHLYTRILIEKANDKIYKDYGKFQKSVIPKLDIIPYKTENKKSTS